MVKFFERSGALCQFRSALTLSQVAFKTFSESDFPCCSQQAVSCLGWGKCEQRQGRSRISPSRELLGTSPSESHRLALIGHSLPRCLLCP